MNLTFGRVIRPVANLSVSYGRIGRALLGGWYTITYTHVLTQIATKPRNL